MNATTTVNDYAPPRWGRLPQPPRNASPVPWLTSLYHWSDPGDFGRRDYPGNCGGALIADVLRYLRPKNVLDPMAGSGTCRDVCRMLRIPCWSADLRGGFDACDPAGYPQERFDCAFVHPPYWRQVRYGDDERCLSNAPTLAAFCDRLGLLIETLSGRLTPGGKLAMLIGDYTDRSLGFQVLTYEAKRLAFAAGLRQCLPDIIRFGHGNGSGRKSYKSSFVPNLHDTLLVFQTSLAAGKSARVAA